MEFHFVGECLTEHHDEHVGATSPSDDMEISESSEAQYHRSRKPLAIVTSSAGGIFCFDCFLVAMNDPWTPVSWRIALAKELSRLLRSENCSEVEGDDGRGVFRAMIGRGGDFALKIAEVVAELDLEMDGSAERSQGPHGIVSRRPPAPVKADVLRLAQYLAVLVACYASSQTGVEAAGCALRQLASVAGSAPITRSSLPLVMASEALAALPTASDVTYAATTCPAWTACEAELLLFRTPEGEALVRVAASRLAWPLGRMREGPADPCRQDEQHGDDSVYRALHASVVVLTRVVEHRQELAATCLRSVAAHLAVSFATAQPGETLAISVLGLYNLCALGVDCSAGRSELLDAAIPSEMDGLRSIGEALRSHMMLDDLVVQHSAVDLLASLANHFPQAMSQYVGHMGMAEWILEMCRTSRASCVRERGASMLLDLALGRHLVGERGRRTVPLVVEVAIDCLGRKDLDDHASLVPLVRTARTIVNQCDDGTDQQLGAAGAKNQSSKKQGVLPTVESFSIAKLLKVVSEVDGGSTSATAPPEPGMLTNREWVPMSRASHHQQSSFLPTLEVSGTSHQPPAFGEIAMEVLHLAQDLLEAHAITPNLTGVAKIIDALDDLFPRFWCIASRGVSDDVTGPWSRVIKGAFLLLVQVGSTASMHEPGPTKTWWFAVEKLLGLIPRLALGLPDNLAETSSSKHVVSMASVLLWGVMDPPVGLPVDESSKSLVLTAWLSAADALLSRVFTLFAMAAAEIIAGPASYSSTSYGDEHLAELVAALAIPCLHLRPRPLKRGCEMSSAPVGNGVVASAPGENLLAYRDALLVPAGNLRDASRALFQPGQLFEAMRMNSACNPALVIFVAALVFQSTAVCEKAAGRMRELVVAVLRKADVSQLAHHVYVPPRSLLCFAALCSTIAADEWAAGPVALREDVRSYLARALAASLPRGVSADEWHALKVLNLGQGLTWLMEVESVGEAPGLNSCLHQPQPLAPAQQIFIAVVQLSAKHQDAAHQSERHDGCSKEDTVASVHKGARHAFVRAALPSPAVAVEFFLQAVQHVPPETLPPLFEFLWELVRYERSTLALLAYRRVVSLIAHRLRAVDADMSGHPILSRDSRDKLWSSCTDFVLRFVAISDGSNARDVIQVVEAATNAMGRLGPGAGSAHLLLSLAVLTARGDVSMTEEILRTSSWLRESIRAGLQECSSIFVSRETCSQQPRPDHASDGHREQLGVAACYVVAVIFLYTDFASATDVSDEGIANRGSVPGRNNQLFCDLRDAMARIGRDGCLRTLRQSHVYKAALSLLLAAWYVADPEAAVRCFPQARLAELLLATLGNMSTDDIELREASCCLVVSVLSSSQYQLRTRIYTFNTLSTQRFFLHGLVAAYCSGEDADIKASAETPQQIGIGLLVYLWLVAKSQPVWFDSAPVCMLLASRIHTNPGKERISAWRLASLHCAEALLRNADGVSASTSKLGEDAASTESAAGAAGDDKGVPLSSVRRGSAADGDTAAPSHVAVRNAATRQLTLPKARQKLAAYIGDAWQWQTAYAEAAASAAAAGPARAAPTAEHASMVADHASLEVCASMLGQGISRRICCTFVTAAVPGRHDHGHLPLAKRFRTSSF